MLSNTNICINYGVYFPPFHIYIMYSKVLLYIWFTQVVKFLQYFFSNIFFDNITILYYDEHESRVRDTYIFPFALNRRRVK